MSIKVQPNGVGSFYSISNSPFSVLCRVSTTTPANTVISGPGASNAIAGEITEFIVTLYDSGNN